MISVIAAMGRDAQAARALSRCLPAVTQLNQLAGLDLDGSWIHRAFRRGLMTEESYGSAFMGEWLDNGFKPVAPVGKTAHVMVDPIHLGNGPFTMLLGIFWINDEISAYKELIAQYREMSSQPFYQIEPNLTAANEAPRGFFSTSLARSLSRDLNTVARVEAMDDSAAVGVALARYRLDHGKMPAQLSDLVPAYLDEIPQDPFSGKPLQLTVKDGDWFIHSIEKAGDWYVGFDFHPR